MIVKGKELGRRHTLVVLSCGRWMVVLLHLSTDQGAVRTDVAISKLLVCGDVGALYQNLGVRSLIGPK